MDRDILAFNLFHFLCSLTFDLVKPSMRHACRAPRAGEDRAPRFARVGNGARRFDGPRARGPQAAQRAARRAQRKGARCDRGCLRLCVSVAALSPSARIALDARRRGSRATTRSHRKWCTTTRWTTATRPPSRRPARRAAARCARRETSSAWVRAFVLSFFRGRSRAITRPPNAHDTRTRARARDAQANIGRHDSLASEMVHDDSMDHGTGVKKVSRSAGSTKVGARATGVACVLYACASRGVESNGRTPVEAATAAHGSP